MNDTSITCKHCNDCLGIDKISMVNKISMISQQFRKSFVQTLLFSTKFLLSWNFLLLFIHLFCFSSLPFYQTLISTLQKIFHLFGYTSFIFCFLFLCLTFNMLKGRKSSQTTRAHHNQNFLYLLSYSHINIWYSHKKLTPFPNDASKEIFETKTYISDKRQKEEPSLDRHVCLIPR